MIQFLAPSALLAGIIACGVLFYVYRNRGTAKRLVVSSLIFVGEISKDRSRPKKLAIPWRLIFEGIIILLLSSLLAKVTILSDSTHELIVIDTSLSSGGLTSMQSSSLSESIKTAQSHILSNPLSRFSVAITNPPKIIINSGSSDLAFRSISGLIPEYGEDKLEINTANWIAETNPNAVHIFTDRPGGATFPEATIHTQKQKEGGNTAIVGGSLSNRNGSVEISNFGNAPRKGNLEILTSNGTEDLKKETEVSFSVEANSQSTIPITLLSDSKFTKISIKESDLNPLDDEFWFAEDSTGGIVVKSPFSIGDLGLAKINEFKFLESSEKPQAIIYHRAKLPDQFTAPSLVILPESAKELQGGITRWDEESRIIKFAKLGEFAPGKIFSVSSFAPGIDYIFSGNESILRSTAQNGYKVLFVGFELFPFEGEKTPTSTVLFLNFLNDLLEESNAKLGKPQKRFSSAFGSQSPRPGILKTGEAQNFVFKNESDKQEPLNLTSPHKNSTSKSEIENVHEKIILIALLLLFLDMLFLAKKSTKRRLKRA